MGPSALAGRHASTPGQAKLSYTAVNGSWVPASFPVLYLGTQTADTIVACLADDGTGVAAAPTCGVVVSDGNSDTTTNFNTVVNTALLTATGAASTLNFIFNAPN
jgi:hypothetical protein